MAQSQKDAVVEAVKITLGSAFTPFKDIALVMLSIQQLEGVKVRIANAILSGQIEYGKDHTNRAEVIPYARSMVMNHLKKARELNGNAVYASNPVAAAEKKKSEAVSGLDLSVMAPELVDFVKTLV